MSGADRGSMRDQIEAARRELEDAMDAALRKPHDGADDQREGSPPAVDHQASEPR